MDRLFMNDAFRFYLTQLFRFSGIHRWIDEQRIWTFTLFPSTMGGRFFTLNIAPHEVAFSTLPKREREQVNMVYMDRLVLDFPSTTAWLAEHDGAAYEDQYPSALEHGVAVMIPSGFEVINEFMAQKGVRRAILAYWSESLITRTESNQMSLFVRHHAYNAVAVLKKALDAETTFT